ncbi:MAG: EVE domain-containing protein [Candidatus Moraniibacteriota bacterium]|nr:MAG: EVE domain-containing protein [Candidatus Moranbacteria bacterium]
MKDQKHYWLMKSEPSEYSIDDLRRDQRAPWFGVRNYQARNFMRDTMRVGDEILFYHSSCPMPGIVGLARVASKPYPDATQFDPRSPYYDPKATKTNPRWMLVDVQFVSQFKRVVTLPELRQEKSLQHLIILRPGNRLSITPVQQAEFAKIINQASLMT